MSEQDPGRGRTVQVGEWWRRAAKERIATLGIRQIDLAQEMGVSEATLSRDIGKNVNVENVHRLARRLGLPPPVFVPDSELEARAIDDLLQGHRQAKHAALIAVDAGVNAITSSARSNGAPPKRQRPAHPSGKRR